MQLSLNFEKRKNVNNLNPQFRKPPHHFHKIPYILEETLQKNKNRDFTSDPLFYSHGGNNPRSRKIHKSRRKALNAMINAIVYHVNIISYYVPASATTLTDYCGLSTIAKSGIKSITRGTRALRHLRDWDLIEYQRRWDQKTKRFFPSKIKITSKMLKLIGVCSKKWNKEVTNKINNFNYRNINNRGKLISKKEYIDFIKNKFLINKIIAYKFRKEEKEDLKAALKVKKILIEEGENELRHILSKKIGKQFLRGSISNLKIEDLQNIVDKRIDILKRIVEYLY
ncbi:Probable replication-associated protein RepA1 (plasmid) [Buchnera aphidicola (Thelaxes suberi)]|uniref:plasmid replication initiator RepA n=1 Tax=Buchnera aphidicola TaxID=9 RepID=UPI003464C480